MSKNIFLKLVNGFVTGIFIGLVCSIFFSFVYSGTNFTPMPPLFIEKFSTELGAFVVSVILWGVIGLIFTGTSFIFTNTDWSITKMTVMHAVISYSLFLPVALYLDWLTLSVVNLLGFTAIYVIIYIVIWSISMIRIKKEINKINQHIH